MTPLRIAYVVGTLRPGGAERQMISLAERLPRDQFEVEFVELSGPGPYIGRAGAAGIRVRTIGSVPSSSSTVSQLVRRVSKTSRYIAQVRGRYDIVDAWLYPAYIIAALFRPLTMTPIIVGGRRNMGDLGDRFGPFERQADRIARRWTDAVVANSQAVADDAVRRRSVDPAKLHVIRNGVDAMEAVDPRQRERQRRAWNVAPGSVVIGCIANLREVKGHDLLLGAFESLIASAPGVHLVLIGDGPIRPMIEARIAARGLTDQVHLHGSSLDPRPLYQGLDLVVQASRSEGLPNSLLEAGASALPVVATAVGGTDEIVLQGETGLLVPAGDEGALASALRRAIESIALRDRLGRAARAHVMATFGMDRFVSEFADLYHELAASRKLLG